MRKVHMKPAASNGNAPQVGWQSKFGPQVVNLLPYIDNIINGAEVADKTLYIVAAGVHTSKSTHNNITCIDLDHSTSYGDSMKHEVLIKRAHRI